METTTTVITKSAQKVLSNMRDEVNRLQFTEGIEVSMKAEQSIARCLMGLLGFSGLHCIMADLIGTNEDDCLELIAHTEHIMVGMNYSRHNHTWSLNS